MMALRVLKAEPSDEGRVLFGFCDWFPDFCGGDDFEDADEAKRYCLGPTSPVYMEFNDAYTGTDPYAGSFLTLNTYEATYDEDDGYRYLSDTWIGGSYQSGDLPNTSGYLIKVNDFFEFEWGV